MVSPKVLFSVKNENKDADYLLLVTNFELRKSNNRTYRHVLLLLLLMLLLSLLILYFQNYIKTFLDDVDDISFSPTCSSIPDEQKIDCYPDSPVSESQCVNRGCCFYVPKIKSNMSLPPLSVPYCYYPSNYVGYEIKSIVHAPASLKASLRRFRPSGFPKDIANLNLLVTFIDDCMLRIKISDADSRRYEVPIELHYQTKHLSDPHYEVQLDPKSGLLAVRRKSTGSVLFSTNLSQLVFSDQLLQLASSLPSSYFYGIGEHYARLQRNVNWTRFTLINSDLPPIPNHGLYGSQPFYMVLENDGKASGVFLFNSNIMDVILQPAPAITFRPIGGIFDFFIMLGPSPNDVTMQYSSIVGKPIMPPFWSLGFHLCRFGYKTLNKTREVMQRNIKAGVALDVQWNDIDYMENYKDFTYDKVNFAGLPEFIDDLHASGRHYVIMTDPGLSNSEKDYAPYNEGLEDDLFIKNENGSIFVGKVWTSGGTVFPDFSHPAAISFWTRQFKRLHEQMKFDGVWIDMNEPSNFYDGGKDGCPVSPLETPQYVPGGNPLKQKTVCMSAKHYYTTHYNEHNIYGYREAVATHEALQSVRKERPFIISRATFPGQGMYSGHWSGDLSSSWEDMRYSIASMINFNMYGIPMVGSDICGFNGNTTVELCARWQSLGAFYPFSRNHNERITIEQDPAALGPVVVEATINSLLRRYSFLPHLYTLFYRSHAFGEPVVRPLFFEFPKDSNTYSIDEQFLWGSCVMIVPCLYPNTTTVTAYFPKGFWYDELGRRRNSSGENVNLNIPLTDIHMSMRGGVIIPGKIPYPRELTTTIIRRLPFALGVVLDEQQSAYGELYWDDGDSLETYENGDYTLIKFESSAGTLNSTVVNNKYQKNMDLNLIQVLGVQKKPEQVDLNGIQCVPHVSINTTLNEYSLFKKPIDLEQSVAGVNCIFGFKNNFLSIFIGVPVSLLSPLVVTWR